MANTIAPAVCYDIDENGLVLVEHWRSGALGGATQPHYESPGGLHSRIIAPAGWIVSQAIWFAG